MMCLLASSIRTFCARLLPTSNLISQRIVPKAAPCRPVYSSSPPIRMLGRRPRIGGARRDVVHLEHLMIHYVPPSPPEQVFPAHFARAREHRRPRPRERAVRPVFGAILLAPFNSRDRPRRVGIPISVVACGALSCRLAPAGPAPRISAHRAPDVSRAQHAQGRRGAPRSRSGRFRGLRRFRRARNRPARRKVPPRAGEAVCCDGVSSRRTRRHCGAFRGAEWGKDTYVAGGRCFAGRAG